MTQPLQDLHQHLHKRIDFCQLALPTFDANAGLVQGLPALDEVMGQLTRRFTAAAFGLSPTTITTFDSVDAALAGGDKDFCLMQNGGHLFVAGPGLAQAMTEALDHCAFLTGHIMERGGYFYLHDQCTLINRRAWERLGRPTFGIPSAGRIPVTLAERSVEDVHDDDTPRHLDSTGIQVPLQAVFGYGWNAISTSLQNNLRVTNWGDAARGYKRHCYAYYGNPAEWLEALQNPDQAPPTTDTRLATILALLRRSL